MPKVGDKEFPYTEAGERQANIYARQTGRKVEYDTNTYGHGSYQEGGEVSQALKKDKAFDTSLQSEFAAAIQRELNPPKDQGRDRHLDNLKVILEYSRKYPEHFAQVMNMKDNKGDIARLKDRLTKSFAKYGEDEINSLMWGNDEWELMQQGGPVKRQGYGY